MKLRYIKKSLTQTEVNNVTNAHKIPEFRGDVINNSYPKLNWATEILPEDILWNAGFEENEQRPNLNYSKSPVTGLYNGEQSFSPNAKYTGLLGYELLDNSNGKGNNYLFPQTQSNSSKTTWSSLTKVIESGMNLSISARMKSSNNTTVSIAGQGGFEKKLYSWSSKLVKDSEPNSAWLYVDELDPSWKLQADGKTPVSQYKVFPDTEDDVIVQDNYITEIDVENKRIRLAKVPYRQMKAGESLKRRNWVNPFSIGNRTISANEWSLYNFNTKVNNNAYYDVFNRGFALIMGNATTDYLYMDDLKVGYATKVRLYRDGSRIYEGYESEFNDTSSKDKSAPTSVSDLNSTMEMINATNSTRRININFDEARDVGTEYDYQVSAVSNDGVETPKSNVLPLTVKSGVKGYSYVIDKNATTNPDNTVDTTSTKITKDITDSGVYYLHIKTIDNAGNVSNTTHYKIDIPTLTAKANPTKDMIRLDWNMSDKNNKTFKVYQKKPGSNEFQSISTTDLSSTKKIKVLNIYPDSRYDVPFKEISFTDWKGNSYTLPESASLKQWMEEPKEGYPKGYGMGIIDVDIVAQSEFNLDPNRYLKNADGSWKYEVIANGFGDGNGGFDYTNESIALVRSFIKDGRGYLVGHDTIIGGVNRNTNNLRDLFNIKLSGDENVGSISHIKGNQVSINKKGLLLNYPHEIGDIGTILDVPSSHSTAQLAYGDIWMTYKNPIGAIATDSNGNGTNNFYLTSFNNTAMIQTGHYVRGFNEDPTPNDTVMEATVDEKKTLANTLFYLNQLSSDNYLDDNSGQDVTAPNKPVIYGHNFTGKGKVEVSFNEVKDNGSTYEYYVQSEDKNGQLTLSNTAKETITSGLKGYSYVVDSKPNTIPDADIEISKAENIKVNINDNTEKYIHIRAIDNVGNASETYHYKITESTKPTMEITGNATEWTNKDVVLNIKADDNDSGLAYIELPNGNRVNSNEVNYTITTNGSYIFKAVDNMGNITTQTIVVDKIDKASPTLTANKVINANKTEATITLNINDNLSGINYLELPNGDKITNPTTNYVFKAIENGIYPFTLIDKAGNKATINVDVFELNTNINPSEIDRIEYKLSGATTLGWTVYDKPFYITNEGITTITARAYDKAGNLSSETTSTVKIDKTKPNNNSILIELK